MNPSGALVLFALIAMTLLSIGWVAVLTLLLVAIFMCLAGICWLIRFKEKHEREFPSYCAQGRTYR